MPFGGLGAKAILETLHEAGGQRDFRQEDQHLLAAPERFGNRLEIDFRLARTGDAVDQRHGETAAFDHLHVVGGGFLLRTGNARRDELRIGLRHHRRRRQEDGFEQALRHQPVDDAGRNACRMGKPAARPRKPVPHQIEHPRTRRRHALRRTPEEAQSLDHRLGIEGGRRAQGHARHEARRRQRVGGNPGNEGAHRRIERRAIEHMGDWAQLLRIDLAVVPALPDDADHLPRPERHLHHRARLDMHPLRHGIAIRARHR